MDWPDDIDADYDDEAFGASVGLGDRPALLVIDLINAFTDPETDLGSDVDDVVDRTTRLLDAFRDRDLPRYFTTVAYEDSYGDAGQFIEKVPALRELRLGPDPGDLLSLPGHGGAAHRVELFRPTARAASSQEPDVPENRHAPCTMGRSTPRSRAVRIASS